VTSQLSAALRAAASGLHPDEAGTGLIISHDAFLHRDDFTRHVEISASISDGTPMAWIDWDAVITALDSGHLPASGGEQRIVRVAASLAAGRDGGNSRNGTRAKTVQTEIGPVEVEVPRDRDGSFTPQVVRKRQRRLGGIGPIVISLTGMDPGFAGGVVAAATARGLILRSATSVRTVLLPPGTVVWKEFDVTPEAIQVGDWVDVRGTPLPDGSLKACSGWIWANIGRADGRVMSVSADGLAIRSESGREVALEFSPRLEVVHADSGKPVTGGVKALRPGVTAGAVGLRLPGSRLRATRIWM